MPVKLTQRLVQFDTRNPEKSERECALYLAGILEEAGFSVQMFDFDENRTSIVARIGGKNGYKRLAFAGHVDTVPLGLQDWSVHPFAAEISDGKLFGRGSSDMKSGVAAFVTSAISLAPFLRETAGLELVIVAGEETGCEGSGYLASLDDALGDVGALVVAEPSYNTPFIGHKGAYWFECILKGKTAHGSMPELGVNAVSKAAKVVTAMEDFHFNIAPHEDFGSPTINVGNISGGLNINSVPDRATVGIDIRTLHSQSHEDIARQISCYLGEGVEIVEKANVQGIWTDSNDPWMQSVIQVIGQITGESPVTGVVPFFTDGGPLKPAYDNPPTIILGPGETHLAHQTDEYCVVEKIEIAAQIYTDVIRQWCGL